jgi:hypothetical protein
MKKSYLDSINNTSEEEIFITTGESRYLEVHRTVAKFRVIRNSN